MKSLLLYFSIFIIVTLIWYGESRKFFCLGDGQCVTVWKTYNSVCYIIPGKYYGLLKPTSANYIETTNLSDLDVIWQTGSSDMIVSVDDSAKNIKQSNNSKIVNYNLHKGYNDSLFTDFDGKNHRYKKGVNYISIFIKENYATDKDG